MENPIQSFAQCLMSLHIALEDQNDANVRSKPLLLEIPYYGYLAHEQEYAVLIHGEQLSLGNLCVEFARARDQVYLSACKKAFVSCVPSGCLAEANRSAKQSVQICMLVIAELVARKPDTLELISINKRVKLWLGEVDDSGNKVLYNQANLLTASRIRYRPSSANEPLQSSVFDGIKLSTMLEETNTKIAGKERDEFSIEECKLLNELLLSIACTLNVKL